MINLISKLHKILVIISAHTLPYKEQKAPLSPEMTKHLFLFPYQATTKFLYHKML